MNVDTRLRETFSTVAETTRASERLDEFRSPMPVRRSHLAVALTAFAATLAVGALALLIDGGPGEAGVGGSPQPPVGSAGPSSTLGPGDTTAMPGGGSLPDHLERHDPPGPVTDPDWVLDPAWFVVDADALALVGRDPDSAIRPPGVEGRWHLRTEVVWCLYPDSVISRGRFDGIRPSDEVTRSHLVQACAASDFAPEVAPSALTVCRGVYTEESLRPWLQSSEYAIVSGTASASPPGFPVILAWESDCVSERVDTNPAINLDDDFAADRFNAARDMEIALIGASYEKCFTFDQANAVAAEARRLLGPDWLHAYLTIKGEASCYRPFVDPELGAVIVMPR